MRVIIEAAVTEYKFVSYVVVLIQSNADITSTFAARIEE